MAVECRRVDGGISPSIVMCSAGAADAAAAKATELQAAAAKAATPAKKVKGSKGEKKAAPSTEKTVAKKKIKKDQTKAEHRIGFDSTGHQSI